MLIGKMKMVYVEMSVQSKEVLHGQIEKARCPNLFQSFLGNT